MKKRTHKLLSILLALVMVLGMLPTMSLTAFAAEPGISLCQAQTAIRAAPVGAIPQAPKP